MRPDGWPQRLVLATHNRGKVTELRTLLEPLGLVVVEAEALGLHAPEETGESYRANAELKARAASDATGMPALADDTGLAVPDLGGAPGIHTARYAAQNGGWPEARRALARELKLTGAVPVAASLCCALTLCTPSGTPVTGFADVTGRLRWPPPAPALPGFAAMFEPDAGPLETDGVLAHRRDAFDRLCRALRPSAC